MIEIGGRMSPRLQSILSRFATNTVALGPTFQAKQLQAELLSTLANLRRMYWLTAGMIAIVFALELVVAAYNFRDPVVLSAIAAAIGVTIWGAVDRMSRLSREMAETTLLVTLGRGLSQEAIERVVQQLLKK
jgi:hypothetical protein